MRKLNVVICDDDLWYLDEVTEYIFAASRSAGVVPSVYACESGAEALEYIGGGHDVDVLFLDIDMPDLKGDEVAHLIRQKFDLQNLQIVCVTSYMEMLPGVARNHVFDAIEKPITYEKIQNTLTKIFRYLFTTVLFSYREGKSLQYIREKSIHYFESDRNQIRIIHGEKEQLETITYYGKLSDELPRLTKDQFYQPHASYIVNLDKVYWINKNDAQMINGQMIPVARGRRDDFIKALAKYDIKSNLF